MDPTKAQQRILKIWQGWEQKSKVPTRDDMYDFFIWLGQNEPELLMFKMQGKERWQTVVAWLKEYEEKRVAPS
jgi:hypothetical protein